MYKEYRVSKIVVKKKNKGLYDYFANICDKARVLFNTTNFLIRQCMSALYKPSEEWQPLQRKAITLINTYIPKITEASENRCNIRRKNILENKKLSDEDKSARLEKLKSGRRIWTSIKYLQIWLNLIRGHCIPASVNSHLRIFAACS